MTDSNEFWGWVAATVILSSLSVVLVGSQARDDARSATIWSLCVLVPMTLAGAARFAWAGRQFTRTGDPGLVVFCLGLCASLGFGYRIAVLRDRASQIPSKGKGPKIEPGFGDDEIA